MLPHRFAVAGAFATVYLVWGSTYLAIRVGVEGYPPAGFAGSRFVAAGTILLAVALATGRRLPAAPSDWLAIAATGLLMLVGGNGLVTWAEQTVPSNLAALIVATSALWMAAFGALGGRGERVEAVAVAGLLIGFGGVALLVWDGLASATAPPAAWMALLLAAASWAAGSVIARRRPVACAPLVTAALQSLLAGLVLLGVSLLLEPAERWSATPRSTAALAYLVVFGSCIAYAAYFWLVHEVSPALLGTYAYVNPAVAVLLGWWLLDERLSARQWLGTAVILLSVVAVSWSTRRVPEARRA